MSTRKKLLVFQPIVQPPLLPSHRQDRRTAGTALPHELILRLFAYLNSPEDRKACRQVCKAWYEVMNDHTLWVDRTVCLKRLLNVPQRCWGLVRKRAPSRLQVRLAPKTRHQLQSTFEQLQLLLADPTSNVTSLHLLISNIDLGATAVPAFGRLQTLVFTNASTVSHSLSGLEAALARATNLVELEVSGFRRFDLSSASHPDLTVLKLGLKEPANPAHLSALLNRLPRLKRLELTAVATSEGKPTRKKLRVAHPWFFKEDEATAYPLDTVARSSILTLVLRRIRNIQNSEIVSCGLPTRMDSLASLSVLDCDFSKEALVSVVTGQHSLTHLDLSGTQCSDDDVIRCLACPLQSLELKMCVRVSMVGLQHVSKMDGCDLTHLGLAHCPQVDPDCASQFPSMFPSLTSLDLSGWSLSLKTLKTITEQATDLRTLVLRGVDTSVLQDGLQPSTRHLMVITT